jgi:hypothetical protein
MIEYFLLALYLGLCYSVPLIMLMMMNNEKPN